MLAPGSPSHGARKGAGSDFGRARLASGHTCEPSSSSRASSILTGSSVLLQTGQVESYVPLSFCLRRNLRRCGAAKDGLFVASESHNANLRVTGLQTADRPVIVNSYFSSLGLQACVVIGRNFTGDHQHTCGQGPRRLRMHYLYSQILPRLVPV
jgi:hypothetical protein